MTFFLVLLFSDFIYHRCFLSNRHLSEIQALHIKQKKELDELCARMGKTRPSVMASSPVSLAGGRRRLSKSKSNKSSRSGSTHSSPHQQGIPLSTFSTKTQYGLYARSQWQILIFENSFLRLHQINVTNRLRSVSQLQEWIQIRRFTQKVKVLPLHSFFEGLLSL